MRKRVKIKYKNVFILFSVIVIIIVVTNFSFGKENSDAKVLTSLEGMTIEEIRTYAKKNNITIEETYEYSDSILENELINGSISGSKINLIISKGQIKEDVYRDNKVNELGRVPIMMYHGIINQEETEYIGGNVDKDGYNRTVKAFREDLEFYYESGYRMIRLDDYIKGIIDVPLGKSPIILTFDDGNKNNFNVLGRNTDGTLKIDPDCAVGVLESFKKKYPDYHVTATFFVMDGLFNQKEYNEEILNWLVDNGYDIGNHTTNHANFEKITKDKTQEVVGKMYQKLDGLLKDKYVKIIALPFGSPYKKSHSNYPYILKGTYKDYDYETEGALRVGWESEVSPYHKNFDKTFLKRCRAYDNNGKEFDIEMVFKSLEKNRYISDGNKEKIIIKESSKSNLNESYKNVITYKEEA